MVDFNFLTYRLGLKTLPVQIIHIVLVIFNLVAAPFLIRKTLRRMKDVLNPKKNESYSSISILILKLIIIQEVIVIYFLSLYLGIIFIN